MKLSKKPPIKKVLLTSLLAYLAIIPSGCNLSKVLQALPFIKPPVKQVELTYWGIFEPKEVFQPLIEEYQKIHPNVKINYEQRAYSTLAQHKETLLTRLREGTGPDIARIHNTWVPQFASELSPLPSDVMSAAEFGNNFYPPAQSTISYQNQLYAIPIMYDGLMLFYNTKHFEEAGITRPPTDWEEFRELALRLTKIDEEIKKITRAGAAMGMANNVAHFSDILGLMFAQSKISFPKDLASRGARDALVFSSFHLISYPNNFPSRSSTQSISFWS